MGVTPEPGDRAPVQGDVSRLGLFGNQALRMGLTGTQAAQVIREVKLLPEGTLRPQTRTELINQARSTLGSWQGAEQAVTALERAAAMLPNSVTARGTVSVPNITIHPQVQVNVSTPERSGLDQAMVSQAALAGSQSTAKGSEV
jgi:CRISPR/Cas system-associated protein Csm6